MKVRAENPGRCAIPPFTLAFTFPPAPPAGGAKKQEVSDFARTAYFESRPRGLTSMSFPMNIPSLISSFSSRALRPGGRLVNGARANREGRRDTDTKNSSHRSLRGIRLSVFFRTLWLAGVLCLGWSAKGAPTASLTEAGWEIDGGTMGKIVFPVPGLRLKEKDYRGEKPVVEVKDGVLTARYPSGAKLEMKPDGARQVAITVSDLPAEAKGLIFSTHLPIRLAGEGRFVLGSREPVTFPRTKDKQIVADGWAESFSVMDPSGAGLRFHLPGNYQQVQDNRVFNWNIFVHLYYFNFADQSGVNTLKVRVEDLEVARVPRTAEAEEFLVDRYGQSARIDYPGKVKSDGELRADAASQEAELAAVQPNPALDAYGGLKGSGAALGLRKTGFFHVEQAGGRWMLVTPEGNAFFQLGVCGIASTDDCTRVAGREKIYEWLPKKDPRFLTAWRDQRPDWGNFSFYAANWIRKFDRPFNLEEWTGQVVKRLRLWGFNSAGAFSANTQTMKDAQFPNVAFLPLGKGDGVVTLPERIGAAELLDPFVPGTEEALDKKFAARIAPRANDPLLIGYFYGNEQHFEELPKKIATYKASKVAAKGRLVQLLREKYRDIAAFNAAWNPAKPFGDFDELKEEPLFIRTDAAAADMQEFYELYLETYFSMVERLFRKYDPNHLLIGSRMTPGTTNNETAVRIAGKYTDVVSINYYSYAIEKDFLQRASEWSGGKPILLSEWFFGAMDTGLGGGKEVANQEERAAAYRNYVEQAAALPFVIGSQWFIYADQSITGRFFEGYHGEGNNTGLVDVTDRPYKPLVRAAAESHARIYDVMLGRREPFRFDDPRFHGAAGRSRKVVAIPRALPGMKMDGSTTNWPGRPAEPIESSRVVIGKPNSKLRGDYRLCWDDENLYFLIHVKDPTPQRNNHKPSSLWNADGVELFIGARDLETGGSMMYSDRQIFLGAGREPKVHVCDHPDLSGQCAILVLPEVSGDGYTLAATLPWKGLGITPKAGMELLFDVAIDNSDDGHSRHQQLVWNGTSKNSKDRGAWGRARLVEN